MITKLSLHGFKSLLSEELALKPLTLLTGINSSGKSSVIQAIRMLLKSGRQENISLDGHGTLEELMNPYVSELKIGAVLEEGESSIIQKKAATPAFSTSLKNFNPFTFLAADRYGPESYLPIYSGENYRLGSRGENLFKVIDWHETHATNLPEVVRHEQSQGTTFAFNLEAWLGVISPNPGFKAQVQELSDTAYSTFHGRRAKNVGFGLSYVLPVITALLLSTTEKGSLVMIENPEAHLHPKGQTEIARLIARCVEAGSQVIIETHSDHIFDGIRIQAKESQSAFHEKIQCYWFELDDQGNSIVKEVGIDAHGRIDPCPDGLFDQFELNARKLL